MPNQAQKDARRQARASGTQVNILARGREIRVGRTRRVEALAARMPLTMVVIPDPLVRDIIQDDEPNDSRAVTNYLWTEYQAGRTRLFRCEIARRSRPARAGGREPHDEPHTTLDVDVPGGLPFGVQVTDICLFLEEAEQRIYTIIDINTDRLEYIGRLTLEEFAHRSSSIS